MSLMRSPVSPEAEGVLRTLAMGPFAPGYTGPEWSMLCQRGYIRRAGPGRMGRTLYVITPSGMALLRRLPPMRY